MTLDHIVEKIRILHPIPPPYIPKIISFDWLDKDKTLLKDHIQLLINQFYSAYIELAKKWYCLTESWSGQCWPDDICVHSKQNSYEFIWTYSEDHVDVKYINYSYVDVPLPFPLSYEDACMECAVEDELSYLVLIAGEQVFNDIFFCNGYALNYEKFKAALIFRLYEKLNNTKISIID